MRLHIWALAALGGAAALAAASPARAQADPMAVVATVNGRTITQGELDAAMKAHGPLPLEVSADNKKHWQFNVLCGLVDGLLWEQYLQKNGPRIEPAELDKHMAEFEEAVKRAGKTMQDYCKDTGQTAEGVRSGMVCTLQWDAIAAGKISDADVKRYYEENKDYFDEVLVRASVIVLKVPRNAPPAEKQAARDNLLAIRAHIVAGKLDFAKAARSYSQDQTAAEGGDLGEFPRKMVMPEPIAKAAFALPVNGVSDVVETDYGLQLIKVTERKPGERPSDFEKMKDQVRDICTAELQLAIMQQLRESADLKFSLPK
ncbi:MAG TPA: peptidylprolyl isomerase [Gemmataceae bacterium]|nr:peptidylprolyl isomerase [Gemmataceae bacterium]